jgi:hypothetical protein
MPLPQANRARKRLYLAIPTTCHKLAGCVSRKAALKPRHHYVLVFCFFDIPPDIPPIISRYVLGLRDCCQAITSDCRQRTDPVPMESGRGNFPDFIKR